MGAPYELSALSLSAHHAGTHLDAPSHFLSGGASLVGLDAPDATDYPVHRLLLGVDVLILDELNLAGVPDSEYQLICPPLKIASAEAAQPARALLLG